MKDQILRNFETFEEIPNGLLLVNEKSNLMYVRIGKKVFVAREFVETITGDRTSVIYTTSYYSVENNKNILTLNVQKHFVSGKSDCLNNDKNVEVIPLSKILNLSGNAVSYLTLEDVQTITNLKEVEPTEKRKYYF